MIKIRVVVLFLIYGLVVAYLPQMQINASGQQINAGPDQMVEIDNMLPINFILKAAEVQKSVARVTGPLIGEGTGFLIADNLLITNNHVIDSKMAADRANIEFNYQYNINHTFGPVSKYSVNTSGFFHTNRDLDYTIIELNDNPGKNWSYIPLFSYANTSKGEQVSIIQHPEGEPKKIALSDNDVTRSNPNGLIWYSTDTLRSSSGSPVFNNNWDVVALHHSLGYIDENGIGRDNEGVQIWRIVEDLISKLRNDEKGQDILERLNLM